MTKHLSVEESLEHRERTGELPKDAKGWTDFDGAGMYIAEYVPQEEREIPKLDTRSMIEKVLDQMK